MMNIIIIIRKMEKILHCMIWKNISDIKEMLFFMNIMKMENYKKLIKGLNIYNNNDCYLYYKGCFQNNNFSGKGINLRNGNKKIDGTFNNINSYEGIYYSSEKEIVYKGNIKDEISMYLNGNIIYNDLEF
jgi:hypothetical protein